MDVVIQLKNRSHQWECRSFFHLNWSRSSHWFGWNYSIIRERFIILRTFSPLCITTTIDEFTKTLVVFCNNYSDYTSFLMQLINIPSLFFASSEMDGSLIISLTISLEVYSGCSRALSRIIRFARRTYNWKIYLHFNLVHCWSFILAWIVNYFPSISLLRIPLD